MINGSKQAHKIKYTITQLVFIFGFQTEFFLAEYFLIKILGGGHNLLLFFKMCEVTICMLLAVYFQTEMKRKMIKTQGKESEKGKNASN